MTHRSLRLLLAPLVAGLLLPLAACGSVDAHGTSEPPGVLAGDPLPDRWRTEVWHDASVEVPAGWGWGAAPLRIGRDTVTCSDDAASAQGYVGRPIMLSDVCMGGVADDPAGPSVWLGVDLEPGREDLGGGWVRETVARGSTTVTVTSDDAALRDRILASVGGPRECAPVIDRPTHPDSILVEGYGDPVSLDVCLYRSFSDDDPLALVYGGALGRPTAEAFAGALAHARPAEPDCGRDAPTEWMTVQLTGEPSSSQDLGGGTQEMAVGCGVVEASPGEYYRLDGDVLDALRAQGLPSTMFAQIGMLG